MKLLHTADIHLKADEPRTIAALEAVLDQAARRDVDLVTIAGDLFDTQADADALRPELRPLLSDNPFELIAIPGNHDAGVYRTNLRFGADLEVLVEQPFGTRQFQDVEVVGVPFTAAMTEELFAALREVGDPGRTQVLLLHCTLDIGFHAGDLGADEGTYFPVTQGILGELAFEYVLAGHIHADAREVPLDGGTFVYPGSPVSHTTRETGRRSATLVDTAAGTIAPVPLETFYHDAFTRTVRPGEEETVLGELETWVDERAEDDCALAVTVDGFVDREEDAFDEALRAAADPVTPENRTRTVREVLQHPLYRRFEARLEARDDVAHPDHTDTQVLGVLADLLSRNEVQPT